MSNNTMTAVAARVLGAWLGHFFKATRALENQVS